MNIKIEKLKTAIKDVLKMQGHSYQDLANHLNCSLPTIKRILGPEDLTLTRLMEICDFLNIDLVHLDTLAKNTIRREKAFTPDQENFLARSKYHLAFLLEIYQGLTIDAIADKYSLTKLSVDKYLISLEKLELINVSKKGKVTPTHSQLPCWGKGELANLYYAEIVNKGATFFKTRIGNLLKSTNHKNNGSEGMKLSTLEITQESYKKWAIGLNKLIDELERTSDIESKIVDKSGLNTMVIQVGHTLVESDSPELKIFENFFGNIENI